MALPKPTSASLNILARKILRENDIDSVWNILNGLTGLPKYNKFLSNKTIATFAKYFEKNPKDIPINVEKLLTFCGKLEVLLDETTIKHFINVLHKNGHHAEHTNINFT